MSFKTALLRSVTVGALLTLAAGAAHAETEAAATKAKHHKRHAVHAPVKVAEPAATAAEVAALKSEIEELKARLDQQSQAQQATAAQVAATNVKVAEAAQNAAAAEDKVETIPEQVNVAVGQIPKPKTDKLYIGGVSVKLGGFVAAETEYRSRSINSTIDTAFTKIPFGNSSLHDVSETRFSAQQSRISGLAEGDVSPDIHVQGYAELDFLGAAQTANFNQSNSFNLRIRHLYSNIDWDSLGLHVLAGQNWSLATLNSQGITPRHEVTPPQIDAQYLVGFVWTRQPQIRITKDFLDKTLWVAVSAENPSTTTGGTLASNVFATSTAGANQNLFGGSSASAYPISRLPDLIGKVAYEAKVMDRDIHLEVFGIGSDFYSRQYLTATGTAGSTTAVPSATNIPSNQDVYGGGVGGGILLPVIPKVLDVQASFLKGEGIGRYATSGFADVTSNAVGDIKPLHELAYLVGGTYHLNPNFDIYAFGGEEAITHRSFYPTSATAGKGYGNPFANNTQCDLENGANCSGDLKYDDEYTLGFWYKPYVGSFGKVQWGVQYSYEDLGKFSGNAGVTGGPSLGARTNDNMVFMSFRYYPFN